MASIMNIHCQPASAETAVEGVHDPARQRIAEDAGQRDRRHEDRDHARAVVRREPVGQVEDDAGEEARLGQAEQEAQDVELVGVETNMKAPR
jgi:hypothetical protein